MSEKKDALATATTVDLAVMSGGAVDLAALVEEFGDDVVGMSLFTRVKMPAGGGRAYEIANADDPDTPTISATIDGVVITHHPVNAYWKMSAEDADGATPPDCSSRDGKTGHGDRGDVGSGEQECKTCPLNEFGSDASGGKACKNMWHLYVLRPDDALPLLVSLPPTSIKPWRDYGAKSIILKHRKMHGCMTIVGLEKVKGPKADYSRATFRFGGVLNDTQTEYLGRMGAELKGIVTENVPPMLTAAVVDVDGKELF